MYMCVGCRDRRVVGHVYMCVGCRGRRIVCHVYMCVGCTDITSVFTIFR